MELDLYQLYLLMAEKTGSSGWWPAETKTELLLGAILVQNTNWKNVTYSLTNLKTATDFSPRKIRSLSAEELQELIRPSGFYRNKSLSIQAVFTWLAEFDDDFEKIAGFYGSDLRRKLLSLRGIGPETADVFLVYLFDQPTFIADKYAQKLLARLGIESRNYQDLKKQVKLTSEFSAYDAQEFHGLIVDFGKNFLQNDAAWEKSFLCNIRLNR